MNPVQPDATAKDRWMGATILWVAVLLGMHLVLRVQLITSHGSYPIGNDEWFLAKKAARIVQTGDPNPGWFKYGSLPIYLTACGIVLGTQVERGLGTLESAREIQSVGYPYYSHPWTMLVPRMLFAIVSVIGLLAAGLIGWSFERRPAAVFFPILALSCSVLYSRQSWTYLNVDILAASLCLLALAYLARTAAATDLTARVLVPAMFCGAIVATKYNSGLIGVPFLLVAARQPRPLLMVGGLLSASLLAFLVFQPFALLDFNRFVGDVMEEMKHYRDGRSARNVEPGLAQLFRYVVDLGRDFGWPLCACAILGAWYAFKRSRVAAGLVLTFPLLVLVHMSLQRLHMARTALPAFAVLSVFMGLGLVSCWDLARRSLTVALRDRSTRATLRATAGVGAFLIVGVAALWPGMSSLAQESSRVESRVEIGRWLRHHAATPCEVLVPEQLVLNPVDVGDCKLARLDLTSTAEAAARAKKAAGVSAERYAVRASFSDKPRDLAWGELIRGTALVLSGGVQEASLGKKRRNEGASSPRLELYRLD